MTMATPRRRARLLGTSSTVPADGRWRGRSETTLGVMSASSRSRSRSAGPAGLSSGAMTDAPASPLSDRIDELWEYRSRLTPEDTSARAEVTAAIDQIDTGQARVAQVVPGTGEVVVDERAKRAILLAFRLLPMTRSEAGEFRYQDRVPLKTRLDGVRVVPGAI